VRSRSCARTCTTGVLRWVQCVCVCAMFKCDAVLLLPSALARAPSSGTRGETLAHRSTPRGETDTGEMGDGRGSPSASVRAACIHLRVCTRHPAHVIVTGIVIPSMRKAESRRD